MLASKKPKGFTQLNVSSLFGEGKQEDQGLTNSAPLILTLPPLILHVEGGTDAIELFIVLSLKRKVMCTQKGTII